MKIIFLGKRQYNQSKGSISKNRKQYNNYCANPSCNNQKKVRRKFHGKNNFYCTDCVRIIDKGEYCGICHEISSTVPKDWVLCDLVTNFFLKGKIVPTMGAYRVRGGQA